MPLGDTGPQPAGTGPGPRGRRDLPRSSARWMPGVRRSGRPVWPTLRCTKAASPTRCEMFEDGAAADLAAKSPDAAAMKYTALAYAHLASGQNGPAAAAAERRSRTATSVPIRFLTGADLRRGRQRRRAPGHWPPAFSPNSPPSSRPTERSSKGGIALKSRRSATGGQDADRGQQRSRYVAGALRSRPRVFRGAARIRKPTPNSTAASSAAARR